MKYMVLMFTEPGATMTDDQLDQVMRRHEALRTELAASGELLNGAGLLLPDKTTTVRLQDATAVAMSGPVVDGEEAVTAYYVVECADHARAVAIAEQTLDFHVVAAEVRAIHDSTGFPD